MPEAEGAPAAPQMTAQPSEQKASEEDNVEVRVLREELWNYVLSMIPVCLLHVVVSLQPFGKLPGNIRGLSLLFGAIGMLTVAGVSAGLRRCSAAGLPEMQRFARDFERANLLIRTCLHVLIIAFANDCTFFRLYSLLLLPLSAARQSHSARSFKTYLVVQNALALCRFCRGLEDGLPWLAALLIADGMLLDIANQKTMQKQARVDLQASHAAMEALGETTISSMFSLLCDACVALGPDDRLAEPAPRLAALLGRQEKSASPGKAFAELIQPDDRERFFEHVRQAEAAPEAGEPDQPCALSAHLLLQVHLLDAYNQPVAVHLFHASLSGSSKRRFIGVCEAWQPKKERRQSREPPAAAPPRPPSERPADIEPAPEAGELRSRRRPDSPRPEGRTR